VRVRNNKQPAKDNSDHNSSKHLLTLPNANEERDVQSSHARRARLDSTIVGGAAEDSSNHKQKQKQNQKTKSDLAYHISNYPYACNYKYDRFQVSVPPPHHRSDSSSTAASSSSSSGGSSSNTPAESVDNEATPKLDLSEEAPRMEDTAELGVGEREDSPALEGDGGFPTGEGYPGTVRWVYCYD
jgi:hypothetical protein